MTRVILLCRRPDIDEVVEGDNDDDSADIATQVSSNRCAVGRGAPAAVVHHADGLPPHSAGQHKAAPSLKSNTCHEKVFQEEALLCWLQGGSDSLCHIAT